MNLAVSIGHGQKRTDRGLVFDSGAVNSNYNITEYETCLNIRKILIPLLQFDKLIQPVYIQAKVPLFVRIGQINELHELNDFDLAIELHLNSYKEPGPNYTEVYYWANDKGKYSLAGKDYGDIMLKTMVRELNISDGKHDNLAEPFGDDEWEQHRNGFVELTDCPALVIEPWFISNNDMAEAVKNGTLVPDTAVAIYKALQNVEREIQNA